MTKDCFINISYNDILDYVKGMSSYDPIEKCIDPMRYEVFNHFIYDSETKNKIFQEEDYIQFCIEVGRLKKLAQGMQQSEIKSICSEILEIAPKKIQL